MLEFGKGQMFIRNPRKPDEWLDLGEVGAVVMRARDGQMLVSGDRAQIFDMVQTPEDLEFTREIERAFR